MVTKTTVKTRVDNDVMERLRRSLEETLADAGVDPEQVTLRSMEIKHRTSSDNKATITVEPRNNE